MKDTKTTSKVSKSSKDKKDKKTKKGSKDYNLEDILKDFTTKLPERDEEIVALSEEADKPSKPKNKSTKGDEGVDQKKARKEMLRASSTEISNLEKEVKSKARQLTALRNSLKGMKKANQAMKGTLGENEPKVFNEDDLGPEWAKKYRDEVQDYIWKPHEGVQTEFLQATEFEVLFSGGRGSGKSSALLVDPLRYINNKNFRGLVIRRTMEELRDLVNAAKTIYLQAVPGTKWKEQAKMFEFPSGARMEFGYLDREDDVERYKGQQYTWIGIDEITQFTSETTYEKLLASVRTTDPTLDLCVRATTNPDGAGNGWVKGRWCDKGNPGESIVLKSFLDDEAALKFCTEEEAKQNGYVLYEDPILGKQMEVTRKWFNSTIADNPTLLEHNPQYVAFLNSIQDPIKRKQWLEGSWECAEGLAFSEFDKDIHVIKPFNIPSGWRKIRGCDWGYSSMAVCLWLAMDWDDNVYVYREFTATKMLAERFSLEVKNREAGEHVQVGYLDSSVWEVKGGDVGSSIADSLLKHVSNWVPSDRSKGSRSAGKNKIHSYLALKEDTGKPSIFIFDTCKELIKELGSLMLDPNNGDDIDNTRKSSVPDHAYDALRYALNTLPDANPMPDPTAMIRNMTMQTADYYRGSQSVNPTVGL